MDNKVWKAQVHLVAFIFFIVVAAVIPLVGGALDDIPVTVVSVQKEVNWINDIERPTIVPGGPSANITLKSNSDVPIINLSSTLMVSDFGSDSFYLIPNRSAIIFEFPYIPVNQTVWRRFGIRSADFKENTTYTLTINGTLQDGKTFGYVYPMMMNYSAMPFPSFGSLYSVSPPVMKGDVDGDNKLTIVDALLIYLHVSGIRSFSVFELAVADINNDNRVTIDDALYIAAQLGLRKC